MTSVLLLLDEVPVGAEATAASDWFSRVERSLESSPEDWISAISSIGQLSDEHAWSLLSWIEIAASQIARERSQAELVTSAFAMALVLRSALDRRDCAIVASLVRRASVLAKLDFPAGVSEGSGRAGEMGREALDLLLHAAPDTPSTHFESGAGESFVFTRAAHGFDVDDLERWLEGDGP